MQVNAQDSLNKQKALKSFFTIESQCVPCLSIGSSDFWNSADNHNRTCKRYIGLMKDIIDKRKVIDDPTNLGKSDMAIRN